MNWFRLTVVFHMTSFNSWRHSVLLKDFLFQWHCLLLISSIANSRRVSFPFVCDFIARFYIPNWIESVEILVCFVVSFTLGLCVSHPSVWKNYVSVRPLQTHTKKRKLDSSIATVQKKLSQKRSFFSLL